MDRTTAKEWTDILVPWIQVVGLIAAGVYALIEYRNHAKETRVQASIDHAARLSSEELRGVNSSLSSRYQRQYIHFEANHPKSTTADYYNFVMDDVLMYGQDGSLESKVDVLIGFLD